MQGVTGERIEANAFRVLGLPGTASQQAIEQAARRMRIWPDERRIPATVWDLPWVGKLSRSKNAVEQAVARLNEPASRVEERLLWFHAASAMLKDQTVASVEGVVPQLASSANWAEKHDAALAGYRAAMLLDPEMNDSRRWRRVVAAFGDLAKSDDYLEYLLGVESSGDFEKRAEPDEVASAVMELPRNLLSGLAAKGESALADGKLEAVANVAKLLREIDRDSARRLLDRMEDLVERRCDQLETDLQKGIVFADSHRHSNEFVCRQVRDAYVNSVEPVLNALDDFGMTEAHRAQRVRWACAKLLSMLGVGWVVAHHFVTAQETFEAALPMAKGTALERKIKDQIQENAPRVEYQEQRFNVAGAPRRTKTYVVPQGQQAGAGAAQRQRRVPPNPGSGYDVERSPQPRERKPFSTSSGGWGSWWWILVLVSAVVRGMVSLSNHSSNQNNTYTPPRMNYPAPPPTYVQPNNGLNRQQQRYLPPGSSNQTPDPNADPSRKKRTWEDDYSVTGRNSPYARPDQQPKQNRQPGAPGAPPGAPAPNAPRGPAPGGAPAPPPGGRR